MAARGIITAMKRTRAGRRQRGRWAIDGSNNGTGDGDGVKDRAACATTGERGMVVTRGHGWCLCFCVCGETTKIRKRAKS
jgi:hypothetical protein